MLWNETTHLVTGGKGMEDKQQRIERLFRELLARLSRQSQQRRDAFTKMLDQLANVEEIREKGEGDNEQFDK